MNIKKGYQTLESIRKKHIIGIKPEERGYFKERGLVTSINSEDYNELPGLLDQYVRLYEEIENAEWLNRKLSGISHDSQRILDGTTPYIMEMPDAGYMKLERYEQFLKLLARNKSRWHRFWSKKKTLKNEKEQLDALTIEVRNALATTEQELKAFQTKLSVKHSEYTDLVGKVDRILENSQAYRLWTVCNPQDDSCVIYLVPHTQKNLPHSVSRYHAAISVREGSIGIRKALEAFFKNNADYIAITANGNLVIEGIESAGLQHDTSFDFDVALDMVEVIMINYKYGVRGEPINWNLIDVRDSLSQIRELRQSSKPFTIRFIPAHEKMIYCDPFYDKSQDRYEPVPQSLEIIKLD